MAWIIISATPLLKTRTQRHIYTCPPHISSNFSHIFPSPTASILREKLGTFSAHKGERLNYSKSHTSNDESHFASLDASRKGEGSRVHNILYFIIFPSYTSSCFPKEFLFIYFVVVYFFGDGAKNSPKTNYSRHHPHKLIILSAYN